MAMKKKDKGADLEGAAKSVEKFLRDAGEAIKLLSSKEVAAKVGDDLVKRLVKLTDKFEAAAKKAKLDADSDPEEAAKQIDALLSVLGEFGDVDKRLKKTVNSLGRDAKDVANALTRVSNGITGCERTLSDVQSDLKDSL
ncbi:MAG: hypothetical protein ACT4OK_13640 [Gemmobacter sp.]